MKSVRIFFFALNIVIIIFQVQAQNSESNHSLYKEIKEKNDEATETISYYKNGNIKYIIPFQNGQIHGKVKYYKKDCRLKSLDNYINGRLEGEQYLYFKRSTYIDTYKSGSKNKIFHVINYNKDGSVREEYNNKFFEGYGSYKLYHKNGNIKIEGQYNGTKRDGIWNFHNKDGSLRKTKKYNNKFVFSFRQYII
tara:strand:- start:168 stop:749 length:582 start_codon:yes stop_codon:yes gene_type:complete